MVSVRRLLTQVPFCVVAFTLIFFLSFCRMQRGDGVSAIQSIVELFWLGVDLYWWSSQATVRSRTREPVLVMSECVPRRNLGNTQLPGSISSTIGQLTALVGLYALSVLVSVISPELTVTALFFHRPQDSPQQSVDRTNSVDDRTIVVTH